ncbi:MAG: putative aldouronate transport system permease protein [Clostridiales bacterium]|nr:putative aldouronate transport system permease protein [Clostridiales bacterium]
MSGNVDKQVKRHITPVAKNNNSIVKQIIRSWQLYLLIAIPLLYIIVFNYIPIYGAQIAFKNFRITEGIWGSPWVGFEHFKRFFNSYEFERLIGNTLALSIYSLLAGFPFPIILALLLNYVNNERFKKTVQMVTYAPNFISTVVLVGMIMQFLSPQIGIVNNILEALGMERIHFMAKPEYFRHIYVWSGVWQTTGFSSIIYIAALAAIDPQLHEAAIVDGATKVQRIWHIDLPGIMPTAIILLILNSGNILRVGFEKALLMQTPLNLRTAEVIDTYVYKIGLASPTVNYSYPAAIGLFQSVIGFILLVLVNNIAKRVSETSLW